MCFLLMHTTNKKIHENIQVKIVNMHICILVSHTRPLRKGRRKEGSGDHAFHESFSWNAIVTKNVTDNHKNHTAGHTHAPQVWHCLAISSKS